MYEENYNYKEKNYSAKKRVKNIIEEKGAWYFCKKLFYLYIFPYLFLPLIKERKLVFKGKNLKYFYHKYNYTWANERAIEIPLVLSFIRNIPSQDILEIGNVLSHYFQCDWDIVDKYEREKEIINEDAVNFKPQKKYKFVISISTLEHIGFDEEPRDNSKIIKAISNIKNNCLKKGGAFIFTLPVGWNPNLDKLVLKNKLNFDEAYYFKRVSWNNKWILSDKDKTLKTKFAKPYIGANGLILGIIKKN